MRGRNNVVDQAPTVCQAVSVPVGETGLALQTSTWHPGPSVTSVRSRIIVRDRWSPAANPALRAAEPLPTGQCSPLQFPWGSNCFTRLREQAGGGQGQLGGFCPCARNKMPPVMSTEGVSSERLPFNSRLFNCGGSCSGDNVCVSQAAFSSRRETQCQVA